MSLGKQEGQSSQWNKIVSSVLLFLHCLLQWQKMTKAAVHSVKAPGIENIMNPYFRISVRIANITHLRSVLGLCVVLCYLWKSLVERCWKFFSCVFVHLYTCMCEY